MPGSHLEPCINPSSISVVLVRRARTWLQRLPVFGNPVHEILGCSDLQSRYGQVHPDGVKNEGVECSPWGSGVECMSSTEPSTSDTEFVDYGSLLPDSDLRGWPEMPRL